jgi:hypothetical protein
MAYQQSVNVSAMNARRAAVSSRVAWGTAGGLAAILFVAVTWATHQVTKAKADVDNLSGQVKSATTTAELKTKEADRLRLDVEIARVSSARAEGELVAAKTQIDQLSHEAQQAREQAARLEQVAAKASEVQHPSTQPAPAAAIFGAPTTQPVIMIDKLIAH